MTEYSQKARTAQVEILPEGPLRENVLALYDQIEALNADQRSLMVSLVLQSVTTGLRSLREELEVTPGANATFVMMEGLLGAAEYGSALEREAAGFTSTGDGKVTDVFDSVREVIKEAVGGHLSPEKRAKIEETAKRVQARIKAGEDPEKVVREEAEASGITLEVVLEKDGAPDQTYGSGQETREVAGSHQAGGQASAQRVYKDEHNLHTGQYL